MKEQDIRDGYVRIRQIDHSIPDEVLDFMKEAAIEKLSLLLPKEDTIEWFEEGTKRPFLNTPVLVEFEDRTIAIAELDENPQRTAWMVKNNRTGQFWRNMTETIVRWRWFMASEMTEYAKTNTLRIVQNQKP